MGCICNPDANRVRGDVKESEVLRAAQGGIEDEIDLRPVHPYYRIRFDDGTSFDYTGDAEAMKQEIARFAPEDADGYVRFVEKSKEIFYT